MLFSPNAIILSIPSLRIDIFLLVGLLQSEHGEQESEAKGAKRHGVLGTGSGEGSRIG
jgi:hypothetical protein